MPTRVKLPPAVLDRAERVWTFHNATKLTPEKVDAAPKPDWRHRPSPYLPFDGHPKTPLPTTLLDLPVGTLALLNEGLDALPQSYVAPPQNLQTLATWLFMADGLTEKRVAADRHWFLRTCPSAAALYPFEIYVAAFSINGLQPGLFHYCPREFALRQLRDGADTLALLKRGRPDLEILKSMPAVLLVTTVFGRSAWKYGDRAFRHATLDAGHLIQNLVTAGTGLGLQTLVRLALNDHNLSELIGVPADAPLDRAERAQALIAWADPAAHPFANHVVSPPSLPPIPRPVIEANFPHPSAILAAHHDCVAPGVAVREIRPPLTALDPVPAETPAFDVPAPAPLDLGLPLREVFLNRRTTRAFDRRPIPRDAFIHLNHLAFRGGSMHPILPDGPHAGLIRPFWVIHDLTGLNPGIWSYGPLHDEWVHLHPGSFRMECRYLCLDQPAAGDASAVCFMLAHLSRLLTESGPDAYRLAHLEAGAIAQRLHLAATAQGLAGAAISAFLDDECRNLLGLANSGWQVVHVFAVGNALDSPAPDGAPIAFADGEWRD